LPFDQWLRLCDLTQEALEKGVIDGLREEVLRQRYGQEKLQFDCATRAAHEQYNKLTKMSHFLRGGIKNKYLKRRQCARKTNIKLHFRGARFTLQTLGGTFFSQAENEMSWACFESE
jgi:hypothetical protein